VLILQCRIPTYLVVQAIILAAKSAPFESRTAESAQPDAGTVVEEHEVDGVSEIGYRVEFVDMTGRTVAVVTVPASSFREATPADRPSVRALRSAN